MEKILVIPVPFLHFLRDYGVQTAVIITILSFNLRASLREERGSGLGG